MAVGVEEVSMVLVSHSLWIQRKLVGMDTVKGYHWALMGSGSMT